MKTEYPGFSVLIPFYNEAQFLDKTLECWLKQEYKPRQIILVDNGSSDGSEEVARRVMKQAKGIDVIYLTEKKPGKICALETGCREITQPFVALSDADTQYPPHYLTLCAKLFKQSGPEVSALMALDELGDPSTFRSRFKRGYFIFLHKLFSKHNYAGGYGQVFRTDALKRAGGFSEQLWPHVLLDHEIMYRVYKYGKSLYHKDLWCTPSGRRENRKRVRWNLFERLVYQFTPHSLQGWFFYRFLGPRFARKGLNHLRLREKPWQNT